MKRRAATPGALEVKLPRATRARLGKARDRSPQWLEKEGAAEAMAREDLERWAHYKETGESYSLDEVLRLFADLREGKKPSWRC